MADEDSLIGKYLEISGELAGCIEAETEKDLLVRRAIVIGTGSTRPSIMM